MLASDIADPKIDRALQQLNIVAIQHSKISIVMGLTYSIAKGLINLV